MPARLWVCAELAAALTVFGCAPLYADGASLLCRQLTPSWHHWPLLCLVVAYLTAAALGMHGVLAAAALRREADRLRAEARRGRAAEDAMLEVYLELLPDCRRTDYRSIVAEVRRVAGAARAAGGR